MRAFRQLLLISTLTLSIEIAASQIQRPLARSDAGAVIEGVVLYAPDLPVANAAVVARGTGDTTTGAIADINGVFRIAGLSAGRFDVEVTRQGQVLATVRGVEIGAGEARAIRIEIATPSSSPRKSQPLRPGAEPAPPVPTARVEGTPSEQRGLERPLPAEFIANTSAPAGAEFIPVDSRWQRGLPDWVRYPAEPFGDYPYVRGRWWDPYNQNKLKGDVPIFGRRWFLSLAATSDTRTEGRRLAAFSAPGSSRFQFDESLVFSADLSRGLTVFRPVDVRFRVTPVLNGSYLRWGQTGWNGHAALQEAFAEVRLAEVSPAFDSVTVRAGTQFFNSDFRGFIFFDNEPGVRLFGTLKANKHQYNLAYFHMLEKDGNSSLNTFRNRHQDVWVANYYIQDFVKPGYTTQFSLHVNDDRSGSRSINAIYLGWTSDGHFRGLNINHAFYQVLGRERPNPTSGTTTARIDARMAALELSKDRDWLRYKVSGFYASGDNDIRDDRARGFDSILDNAVFGGGTLSFWNRQGLQLGGTGLGLKQRFSLSPSLRAGRDEGQSNFVNPGLWMFSAGTDAELTPRFRATATASYLSFAHTNVLETLLFQPSIRRSIGVDLGVGATWRPLLNNNVVITGGVSALLPGAGLGTIYTPRALFSTFLETRLAY